MRACALIEVLSKRPLDEVLESLKHCSEDAEVVDQVRETLAGLDIVEAQSVRSGMKLGRYEVGPQLGAGSYGEVYQGRDNALGRIVALKFLSSATLLPKTAARGLVAEAQAASALNHPNIVTVYEVIESETGPVIVMELVEGRSLREVMRTRIPTARAKEYGTQLLEALAAAHAKGIVHRDVKPENIMVRPDGYLKVLDFGLARQVEDSDGGNPLWGTGPVGTLRYMSPEQCAGSTATAASDIFSAGLVVCEMATGAHPFGGATPIQTAERILRESPAPKTKGRLVTAALQLLARNPEDRPSAARAVELLKSSRASRAIWIPAAAVAVLAVAIAAITIHLKYSDAPTLIHEAPLTSNLGQEDSPNLSPDGQSVVYLAISPTSLKGTIMLKRFDQDSPTKLVEPPADGDLGKPTFSPNGQRVLYKTKSTENASGSLWSISLETREKQRIKELVTVDLNSAMDWSRDGRSVVYTDQTNPRDPRPNVRLFNLQSGKEQVLTHPPADSAGDFDPKFSPDGLTIAFKRAFDFQREAILLIPSHGGPVRAASNAVQQFFGFDWMPDGRSLLASRRTGGRVYSLTTLSTDPHQPAHPVREPGPDNALQPSVRGERVAWVSGTDANSIFRIPISGGPRTVVAGSTTLDAHPDLAPDGRLAFVSRRSGTQEIWLAAADGSAPVRVTDRDQTVNRIVWSPDSSHLLFSTSSETGYLVAEMNCPATQSRCDPPHPISPKGTVSSFPVWSPDGHFIYFTVSTPGAPQIYRMAAEGGNLTQITFGESSRTSRISPDGHWLYFYRPPAGIWRTPLNTAKYQEEQLIGPPYRVAGGNYAVTNDEVIFWDLPDAAHVSAIRAFNPSTRLTRTIAEAQHCYSPSVSPDGKTLYYAGTDRAQGHIIIMTANWKR